MTVAGREAAAEQQGPVSARTQNPAAVSRRNPSRGGRVPSTRRPMGARAAALQPITARADSTPWPSAAGGRGARVRMRGQGGWWCAGSGPALSLDRKLEGKHC